MRLAILSIGMAEKNDSVCNDVAHHYRVLSSRNTNDGTVRLFAGSYDPSAFPDLPVENASAFEKWLTEEPETVVLFHYCDSRSPFDDFLREKCQRVIIRWYNATPPWFTFGVQNQNAHHALLGYENIIQFINRTHVSFWANSAFTRDQLVALGAAPERCHIVFPASRYLTLPVASGQNMADQKRHDKDTVDLLFVSDVVAHKGHLNAIAVAERAQEIIGRKVRLHIVGKGLDEPSAFSARLRLAIEDARADIIVHGPVSDDALVHLYQTADIFVCVSEHEGFGLPVFEAMRYQLPVIAWAATAFRELLAAHPFAFPNFDLDLFAAAIGALETPSVRNRLLEIQYAVLQTYSSDILKDQILTALAAQESRWGQPVPDDLSRPAIRYLPRAANAIDVARSSLYERYRHGFDANLTFDSHMNVTSLHDLRMFKDYLTQGRELVRVLTVPAHEPSVTFRPEEFSMCKGVYTRLPEEKAKPPAPIAVEADHLIFGPYAQMPPGQYRATLHATIKILSEKDVPFEIDVNSDGQQVASRIVTLPPGEHTDHAPIPFTLVGDAPRVEIRLRAVDAFEGNVIFSGITLAQTEGSGNAIVTTPSSGAHRWLTRLPAFGPLAQLSSKRQAKSLFRKGDAARDSGAWAEAARFYDMGLHLEPDRYAYIMQAAQMHEEAGNLEAARTLYSRALSLLPNDADLCLRIGHFYKRSGDAIMARQFYLKALSVYGSVATDAGAELLALPPL
ncbi:glycosyltransferase [Acidomonas methanolica]|uniref:Glycosyl transferase group 1 n=2 Tax=Acidomonas methanolica TaxID=437 RepID=A0A023D3C2_ACIMT|nr:glycosyltransferase [Acidomonas methanolica]TCS28493.1 glycosyltransferase involved in cell wall biosynthesis [Acidomonas methanolica]GAJ28637.1 glycosyl transferase group 1 [Acidomonas methanolica NBRC 104435]GBQ51632.1 hypothetical protein AA0498_1525 [Acidomonas methanolica]GEK99535.1 hypothetical protein AME01nite_20340 [Acidomonas methanolica NBRC 104435]